MVKIRLAPRSAATARERTVVLWTPGLGRLGYLSGPMPCRSSSGATARPGWVVVLRASRGEPSLLMAVLLAVRPRVDGLLGGRSSMTGRGLRRLALYREASVSRLLITVWLSKSAGRGPGWPTR